jgi:hypothetical protein
MSGLILELQRDALSKSVDVSALLRKALVVSKKLDISEIQDWINAELTGYAGKEIAIPAYRIIHGAVKIKNPYHGLVPLHYSTRSIGQPIGELDSIALARGASDLHVPFTEEIKNRLMNSMEFPLEPVLTVSPTSVVGILEAVRTEVLNWH